MHLFHIADTHLGLAAFNRLDPESGMNLREKQDMKVLSILI
jgi:exonuclease SbcD